MIELKGMTDREVLDFAHSGTPLARAREIFREGYAEIEQSQHQRVPMTNMEVVRKEFEIVEKITNAFVGAQKSAVEVWILLRDEGEWDEVIGVYRSGEQCNKGMLEDSAATGKSPEHYSLIPMILGD